MINECLKVHGSYRFEGYDIEGHKVYDETFDNVVTQLYFDLLFEYMDLTATECDKIGITYFSTGSDDTAVAKTDTTLGTEVFRKSVTSVSVTSNKVIVKTVLAASESVFNIKEVGLWAEGSLTLDSGTLISHCNVDIDKNSSTAYNVTYTFTIE